MAEAHQSDTRVAVITGGAGGLGQAYAERLARAGFDVAVADRVAADETVERVEALGRRCMQGICDVTSETDVAAFMSSVQTEFGRADALVNNAGIFPAQPFLEMSFADFRKVIAVNLDGTFLFCRAFAPMMVARQWGRIVNVASSESWMSVTDNTHYMAAKMGIVGLSRGMASELGPMGITVNAIAPGMTKTPGTTGDARTAAMFDQIVKMQAIPRTGEVADLAGLVAFLVSDESSFITGQTIVCDGGLVRL